MTATYILTATLRRRCALALVAGAVRLWLNA
jgi:hypothetical protein